MSVNPILAALSQQQQTPNQSMSSKPQVTIPQGNTVDRTQQAIQNAQAMMQQFKMAGNPMQMLAQNPNYQRAMQRIQAATNPRQAFYNRARELGVDPEEFIRQIQGGM